MLLLLSTCNFLCFQAKSLMGDVMKEASFSLAEVKFAASGDISHTVLHNVSKASVRVRFSKENVAGELLGIGVRSSE